MTIDPLYKVTIALGVVLTVLFLWPASANSTVLLDACSRLNEPTKQAQISKLKEVNKKAGHTLVEETDSEDATIIRYQGVEQGRKLHAEYTVYTSKICLKVETDESP